MLRGQSLQSDQRNLLVTVQARAVGEPTENLVLPFTAKPGFRTGIGKLFELPGRATHIGRRTKDNGIRLIEFLPGFIADIAFLIDSDQFRCRAFGNNLCQTLGVAVAGMKNNHCLRH
ncbi:hypothetical protein D3C78_885260 [compost metagenome]